MDDNNYGLYFWTVIFLLFLAAAVFILSLFSGSASLSPSEIWNLIARKISGELTISPEATVIFSIRLPRIILGFLVGGALALAGVIFQGLFRNPLVEPFTLGVSGGAALTVSLAMACGWAVSWGLPFFGFLGSLGAIFIVYRAGRAFMGFNTSNLLLVGVMFSFISSSLIMLVLSLSRAQEAHGILLWIMGSLEENDPFFITLLLILVPLFSFLSFSKAWELNALSLGDEEALHLGIDTRRAKKNFFIISSLLAGAAVACAGIIGFVGLVVPHILRTAVGGDHRFLLPASFILGGIFLVLCDTLARVVIAPVELPVGVITGIIGGVMFIAILLKQRGAGVMR